MKSFVAIFIKFVDQFLIVLIVSLKFFQFLIKVLKINLVILSNSHFCKLNKFFSVILKFFKIFLCLNNILLAFFNKSYQLSFILILQVIIPDRL